MPLVGKHSKQHFLVNVLGSKRIHKHRSPGLVSVDECLALIDLLEQLSCQHPPVDQINPEVSVVQLPFPQFKISRVSNGRRVAVALKEFLEQLELALRR